MAFRTADTYSTSRGTFNTRKHTFAGKGPAPAGSRKVRAATAATAPTTTISSTGQISTSGFGTRRAARRARRAARASQRRARRITRSLTPGPQRAANQQTPKPPKYTPPPTSKPETFQGKPTAGTPTLGSLQTASRSGTLKVNKAGFLTTPQVRKAGGALKQARKAVRRSQPSLAGLSPAERDAAHYAEVAHRKYPDIPTSVLMSDQRQESGFDPNAVSSAGAFGRSQFIPSTAAEYGVRPGSSKQAKRSQAVGQAHYLHDLGFAQNPQKALSSYSGGYAASDYNDPVLVGAKDYAALDKPGNPRAVKRLAKAKAQAKSVGLNTKPKSKVAGPGRIPSVVYIGHQAEKKFGLHVGENPAFGGVSPVHVSDSYHYRRDAKGRGEAIDASGPPDKMMAFDRWVAQKYGGGVTELFYDPGTSIKDGQVIGSIGGHSDHVHVAVAQPGEHYPGGLPATAGPSGAMFVGYGETAASAAASSQRAAQAAAQGRGRTTSPLQRYRRVTRKLRAIDGPAQADASIAPTGGVSVTALERKYGKAAA